MKILVLGLMLGLGGCVAGSKDPEDSMREHADAVCQDMFGQKYLALEHREAQQGPYQFTMLICLHKQLIKEQK